MTEGIKTLRLSKVAKEFNIGTTTIVEFLSKKGFSVENNPNAKISGEAYDLLCKEFQSEKTLKEATQKVGLNLLKRETISIEGEKAGEEEARKAQAKKQEKEEEELFIKDLKGVVDVKPVAKPEVKPEPVVSPDKKEEATTVTTEEAVAPKAKGPKVLGVLDVDKLSGKKTSSKKPDEVAVPSSAEEQPTEETKASVEQDKVAPPEAAKEVEPQDVTEPTKEEKPSGSQLKIIGKMDLTPKRPLPKEVEKDEETPEATVAPEVPEAPEVTSDASGEPAQDKQAKGIEAPLEAEKKEVFFKTQVKKLEGPTILGRMDLPVAKEPAKKPVASSVDDGKSKRKKRKRIKKEKPTENTTPQVSQQPKTDASKARRITKKDQHKPELTEEEISKQIRETLASLSGTGKSKASKHRRTKRDLMHQQKEKEMEMAATDLKVLQVTEFVSAAELASLMNVSVNDIISTCMSMGLFVSINQRLDAETITIVADEFGYEVNFVSVDSQEIIEEEEDNPEDIRPRAPIVTVMGHVDHGKTSLLDQIRHSNIISGEAGGITQHIGAYSVEHEPGKTITFLDTPGHEAFTAMRARGAKVTDVAIIVVAADDNVMPQTVEAINHAQAAGVPIVIAINKIDKPSANVERVKEELAKINILVEDWGGKYQSQEISAKNGVNIENLLEKVLLEAELLDLKANPAKRGMGTVIESSLDKGRGYLATVLIQNGSMRVGDIVVAGITHGKVKAMFNERGQRITQAGPSTPVLILGLDGAPQAGDIFNVMASEHEAKSITTKRQQLIREQGLRTQKHITLDEIGRRIAIGDFKELNIIVKGDVDGSIEALGDALLKLSTEEVQVNIIHKAVGPITEGDVLLASASNAIVVGFQVRPSMAARKLAESEQIDIRLYSIIYNAINEIKSAIEGMLSPDIEEKITANLEVRDVFKITKVGTVAGCMVLDGKIHRNANIRLIRDGIVVFTGHLGSLKRFKDDVKEVSSGYECGLNIDRFNDIKVGDIIESYETKEIARKLD